MRNIIAIILVLIGFSSYGQLYLAQTAKWEFKNSQKFDSTVRMFNLSRFTGDTVIGFNPYTKKFGYRILTSSGGTWGSITGTLSNQTDLQNALNAKGSGTVTSVSALTLGTTGTDLSSTVANSTTTPVITLNVPTASASNRGALSSTDWTTFNGKESVLTFSRGLSRSTNTVRLDTAKKYTFTKGLSIPYITQDSTLSNRVIGYSSYWGADGIWENKANTTMNFGTRGNTSNGNDLFAWYGDGGNATIKLNKIAANSHQLIDLFSRVSLGTTTYPWKSFSSLIIDLPSTVTAIGTTGNQTINKISGTVNIAAAGTSVTVTNSLVTANSIVTAVIRTNDATATIKNVVPSSGSFVITLNAAARGTTSIGFIVFNQ